MLDRMYDPFDWFWIVGGRDDYWSSTTGGYIETLPDGAGVTRIADEDELTDVLAVYGLPGPVERVPAQVSLSQAKIALYRFTAGDTLAEGEFLSQVDSLIETYPYVPVRIWWQTATYIARDHPYLEAVAIEMGLSAATVDGLFLAADAI